MIIRLLLLLLFTQTWAFAQRPTNSLFLVNPSLYNPSYVGYHQRTEIIVGYMQQWIGINEAPSIASFQFNSALSSHVGLGIQTGRQTTGPMQHHHADLLFSYKALLGQHSSLNFGLSGGIYQTGLSQKASYNPADPAVSGLLNTSFSPRFAFGTSIQFKELDLGVSLPELFPHTSGIASDLVTNEPFNQFIINGDYRFILPSENIAIRPFFLYHQNKLASDIIEGGGLVYFQDLVYVGGGYRLNYGPTLTAGVQIDDFRFGYGYEHPTTMVNQIGQGGHEIQLSYRFGKLVSKKKPRKKKKDIPLLTTQPEADTLSSDQLEDTLTNELPSDDEEVAKEETNESAHMVLYRGNHPDELGEGFYVIAGSFANPEYARQQVKEIGKKGTFAGLGYNSERAYYYIFIYRSDDLAKTRAARNNYRQNSAFQDAWLLEIKER